MKSFFLYKIPCDFQMKFNPKNFKKKKNYIRFLEKEISQIINLCIQFLSSKLREKGGKIKINDL